MARARVDYESFVRADGSRAETDDSGELLPSSPLSSGERRQTEGAVCRGLMT
jgi:hypothetical protein